jgi:coenzyme PQQ synthesis protein D (PqqD)
VRGPVVPPKRDRTQEIMTDPTTSSCIKLNDDVLIQELQGDAVLLDLKTGVYFGLDRVGTRMWRLIGEHKAIPDIVNAVTEEFDVSEQKCTDDVLAFVKRLNEQGLIAIE